MENFLAHWGYLAIFLLPVAESACIPIPSELTLGLGGALASGVTLSGLSNPHHLNLALVIVAGVAGSVVGSFIAYAVGRTGGRAFVDRFGRLLLLTHRDLDRAEAWFDRRGEWAVLIGRIIPVVRTFISFPAGMAEMEPARFGVFTAMGVTVWVGVLSGLGYAFGGSYHKLVHDLGAASYVVAGIAVVLIALGLVHRIRVVRAQAGAAQVARASGMQTHPGEAARPAWTATGVEASRSPLPSPPTHEAPVPPPRPR